MEILRQPYSTVRETETDVVTPRRSPIDHPGGRSSFPSALYIPPPPHTRQEINLTGTVPNTLAHHHGAYYSRIAKAPWGFTESCCDLSHSWRICGTQSGVFEKAVAEPPGSSVVNY